ncbi:hypothetical protein T4D_617 [Trichinella pseudospiralis]|uniref:Uncharacterized protein n=1 Tax=Trichinella pseudospiralis TaxID=6337 RepID=A0A0V1FWV2_TRIPS|nr:hypothetical protein T4D_617 [Trichinella pseudospiralis]
MLLERNAVKNVVVESSAMRKDEQMEAEQQQQQQQQQASAAHIAKRKWSPRLEKLLSFAVGLLVRQSCIVNKHEIKERPFVGFSFCFAQIIKINYSQRQTNH